MMKMMKNDDFAATSCSKYEITKADGDQHKGSIELTWNGAPCVKNDDVCIKHEEFCF